MRKFFLCRCTSTFSVLNHCGGILLKYFCYLYEVVRTNFRRFFDFSQFLIAILRKLWLCSHKNENYLAHLKGQSLLKKKLKTASKSTRNQRHKTCSKYIYALERTVRRPRSVTKKQTKNIQIPYFRTYSRRALFDPPQLCTVVELVVPILKDVNHFSI